MIDPGLIADLGIAEIDRQHRKILHMIKELASHQASAELTETTVKVIHEMADYSLHHFGYEEGLMARDGYDGLAAHQQLHGSYNHQVREFARRFGTSHELPVEEVVGWLWNWWVDHIQICDRAWSVHHLASQLS